MHLGTKQELGTSEILNDKKTRRPFNIQVWLVTFALGMYLLNLVFVSLDKEYQWHWLTFGLWLVSVGVAAWGTLYKRRSNSNPAQLSAGHYRPVQLPRLEILIYCTLIFLALLIYTLFLNIYPFPSIGDELRDTALYDAGIARGEVHNFFTYGSYNSYGLVIPVLTYPLYWWLGPNVMVIRLSATLVGLANIVLLYHLARRFMGFKVAAWATLILIGLPLHLYYSRTEVVVLLSATWWLVLLFCFGRLFEQNTSWSYGLVGLTVGLMLNFHASAKAIAVLSLLLAVAYGLFFALKDKSKRARGRKLPVQLALLFMLVLVGFGPAILFTPADIFLQTGKSAPVLAQVSADPSQNTLGNIPIEFNQLGELYSKSLLVYFYEPTYDHYHDHKPILPFILGLFFVIGLVEALLSRRAWLRLLAIYALAIPFTNSVLTDLSNADRRLMALLPLSALLSAYGAARLIARLLSSAKGRLVGTIFISALLVVSLGGGVYNFFNKEPASYGMYRQDTDRLYQDFLLTYTIKTIQTEPLLQNHSQICLEANPATIDYLQLNHIQEQFKYYLPDKTINLKIPGEVPDETTIYVGTSCHADLNEVGWKNLNYCNPYEKFLCPVDYSRFTVFAELESSK